MRYPAQSVRSEDDPEVSRVRRLVTCPKHPNGTRWGCDRGFETPSRQDCFDCGYNIGWETCQVEITMTGDDDA